MRPTFGRQNTTDASSSEHAHSQVIIESTVLDENGTPAVPPATGPAGNVWKLDEDAQLGVKKAQATTLTRTKTAVYTTLSWYVSHKAKTT